MVIYFIDNNIDRFVSGVCLYNKHLHRFRKCLKSNITVIWRMNKTQKIIWLIRKAIYELLISNQCSNELTRFGKIGNWLRQYPKIRSILRKFYQTICPWSF
jgi:hypothetical protein